MRGEETWKSDAVSEVKHRHGNSVASLQCAPVDKFIVYITMHKQTTPIYKLSCSKASNTFRLSDIQEKPVDLFYGTIYERRL